MPMVVYIVGVMFRTEKFTLGTGLNMVVVGTGIAIASYGACSVQGRGLTGQGLHCWSKLISATSDMAGGCAG